MRIESSRNQIKDVAVTFLLSIAAFTIMGCAPATVFSLEQPADLDMKTPVTVIHIPDMDEYQGFTTLERIIVFGDGDLKQLADTVSHERRHIGQIEEAGGTIPYWIEYGVNPIQACEWEKEAGAVHHQACELAVNTKVAIK